MTDTQRASVAAPRPQRADARRNFEAILAAAREAFAVNGPDASLEEIARNAGVGIGTLYRNFPARSDLINSLYADEVEELCRAADNTEGAPPWEALMTWLQAFAEYCMRKRALVEGLNRDSELFTNARDAMYAAGEPLLKRAQESGDARSDLQISDVMYFMTGLLSSNYQDDEQRNRVIGVGMDAIRAR
jgi:AcrR family transcriptional regulator